MNETGGSIRYEVQDEIAILTIDRYEEARNAVDPPTGVELYEALRRFEADESLRVAVLTGAGGVFCAGFDLKYFARLKRGETSFPQRPPIGYHSMGPTRVILEKPVIAAVEGYAVAGGLELACWCDMRVAARDAVFGVYCRRWGMPLADGGTVRLTRIVGQAHALDMILTGRGVAGEEALRIGLVQRLVEPGQALSHAIDLARHVASFPQGALRADRRSALEQWSLPELDAVTNEIRIAMQVYGNDPEALGSGAERFESGTGRHGTLADGRKLADLGDRRQGT
jgi:enoyl-CoA hydratase